MITLKNDQLQDPALSKSHDYVNLKRRRLQHIFLKSLHLPKEVSNQLHFIPTITLDSAKQLWKTLKAHSGF